MGCVRGERGDAGTPNKRGGAVTPCAFVEALPPLSGAAELHRSGANLPSQIYSAFIRCNTLYLAIQGVCHPFPLDSLKGGGGAEAIPIYCLCILATLRHFSAQAHRCLYLICRIEVDNILTLGSNVSLRNGRVYPLLPPPRPPFSRRRLCICGGSYHTSDDTARVVILSTWSKYSLTIRCLLFSQK